MTPPCENSGAWRLLGFTLATAVVLLCPVPVRGQDCGWLLGLFQQGLSTGEIARDTGLTGNQVEACRRQLQQPIFVGPEGAPPQGAVGPAPRNAAGPPPVGHEVKRLP